MSRKLIISLLLGIVNYAHISQAVQLAHHHRDRYGYPLSKYRTLAQRETKTTSFAQDQVEQHQEFQGLAQQTSSENQKVHRATPESKSERKERLANLNKEDEENQDPASVKSKSNAATLEGLEFESNAEPGSYQQENQVYYRNDNSSLHDRAVRQAAAQEQSILEKKNESEAITNRLRAEFDANVLDIQNKKREFMKGIVQKDGSIKGDVKTQDIENTEIAKKMSELPSFDQAKVELEKERNTPVIPKTKQQLADEAQQKKEDDASAKLSKEADKMEAVAEAEDKKVEEAKAGEQKQTQVLAAAKEGTPVQTEDEDWAENMPHDLSQVDSQNFIHQKIRQSHRNKQSSQHRNGHHHKMTEKLCARPDQNGECEIRSDHQQYKENIIFNEVGPDREHWWKQPEKSWKYATSNPWNSGYHVHDK